MSVVVPAKNKNPLEGVDPAAAAKTLAGTRMPSLEVDWLARDADGRYAVFLGDESSRAPAGADLAGAAALLDAVRASFDALASSEGRRESYRSSARASIGEAVWDLPRRSPTVALHESRASGYPHLLFAAPDAAEKLRDTTIEYGGRETVSREGFAVIVDALGALGHESLHEQGACAGCRVLDLPGDPPLRSPAMLASLGFYVYVHADGTWLRVASPSVPADASDLEAIGCIGVRCISLQSRFDETPSCRPD